jgi:hypothetical protein
MNKKLSNLKEELKGWEASVAIRTAVVKTFKVNKYAEISKANKRTAEIRRELRMIDNNLKLRNKLDNKAKRELAAAKKNVANLKKQISLYPSQVRQLVKKNLGKSLEVIEEA